LALRTVKVMREAMASSTSACAAGLVIVGASTPDSSAIVRSCGPVSSD
jgi:hypothetical protein